MHKVEIYVGGTLWGEHNIIEALSRFGEVYPLSEIVRGHQPGANAVVVATPAEAQGIPPRLVDSRKNSLRLVLINVHPRYRLSGFFSQILHCELPPLKEHQRLSFIVSAVRSAVQFLELAAETKRLSADLDRLNRIGAALSAERNSSRLLEMILASAIEIACCDAGSLYLVDKSGGGKSLQFVAAINESVEFEFKRHHIPLDRSSIAGYVADTGEEVHIENAYRIPNTAPFAFNRTFDILSGYRTVNILAVPLKNQQGEVLGVLQLINRKTSRMAVLRNGLAVGVLVRPFDSQVRELMRSLASQAAVALENARLYEEIRQLFEGFVEASIAAIESRDPATMGHSKRVAQLSVALAKAVSDTSYGPLAGVHFSQSSIDELRFAALLHDFGKVGVPEAVLLKSTKLPSYYDELFKLRTEIIKLMAEIASLERERNLLIEQGLSKWVKVLPKIQERTSAIKQKIQKDVQFVINLNRKFKLNEEDLQRLQNIANTLYTFPDGRSMQLLNHEEACALGIKQGNLLDEERRAMDAHVYHTYKFLSTIPWSEEFKRVPEFAYMHHEKLDGSGYPQSLAGDEIPIQARIIALCDMYDALTALDRPYKKAMSVDEALEILQYEVAAGRLDKNLFELFLKNRIYERIHQNT